MIYKRTDQTRFLQGLPMQDILDDATLSTEQLSILETAVSTGIYSPADAPPARYKKVTNDKSESKDSTAQAVAGEK